MDIKQAMEARHAVRSFTDKKIDDSIRAELTAHAEQYSKDGGIDLKLVFDEPNAFGGSSPHYGSFKNCNNYIAIFAKPGSDEKIGYYGEKLVLQAQLLGLNTCWVALTYSKNKVAAQPAQGEKLQIVIALGYGDTQGVPHKNKPIESLYKSNGIIPDWFKSGMEAAMTAPTAMNQQKFLLTLKDGKVSAKAGLGFYSKIDLGIVKYHFELGAGPENFQWA